MDQYCRDAPARCGFRHRPRPFQRTTRKIQNIMNRKQLTILIVAGAVLGVIGWVIYNKRNSDDTTDSRGGQKIVKNFPMNDVEQISIRQASAQVNLAKQNDIW